MNKILELKNISVGYEDNPLVLKEVNLSVYENDFLGIIGPNGGGKTTLIKTILGLTKPAKGCVCFFNNTVKKEKLNIGYLPQINQIDKKFPISVFDVILSGIKLKKNIFSTYSEEDKKQAKKIAVHMGLEEQINKPIGALSGGQLQRTLLGRAIVDNPKLLILDEPNSYVDKKFENSF